MNSAKTKNFVLTMQIALIIVFALLTGLGEPAVTAQSPVQQTSPPFTVPVTIQTYGNAWNGYLAFGLWEYAPSVASYLVVMTTNGQVLYHRTSNSPGVYWPVKYIAPDTLMYMGAQQAGPSDANATHFWNMETNVTTDFPNVYGHHDIVYNPTTRTFLTLRDYIRVIDGHPTLMDHINELSSTGAILWSWDTYADGHINLSDECPCNDTTATYPSATAAGQVLIDLTHSNSLQWDFNKNIIYLNMRAQNTFCKIDKTAGKTVWCLGEHGNFTLYDQNGNKVPSLWYHSHDLTMISPDVFLMFDNDYHNTTQPCQIGNAYNGTNSHSRILEVTVDEHDMTARTTWSWSAPSAYWTPYWGSADVLPNGDLMAAFGSQDHYVPNSSGGVIVEVNPQGQVVRTYTFPYGSGMYRVTEISPQVNEDYDNAWHSKDFTINLSAVNSLGGVQDIFYKINNGPAKTVNTNGQPTITTDGANNTLEFWSVDRTGIQETPHQFLTGIKLDKTPPSISINSPTNGTQVGSSVTVTWTGSDTLSGISGYEIGLDGRALKSVGTNSTYVLSGLDNGNHMVEVKALDNAGNQNDASVNFVVSTGSTGSIAIAATVIAVVAIILIATIYGVRKRRKT